MKAQYFPSEQYNRMMWYRLACAVCLLMSPFDKKVSTFTEVHSGEEWEMSTSRLPYFIQDQLYKIIDWLHAKDDAAQR